MRILVVDDDPATRKFMQKYLSKYGRCQVAENGEMAIKRFKEALAADDKYDLICLDIMMPGMDGYGALKAIRSCENELDYDESQRVKVIMASGMDVEENVPKSFDMGCAAYITKPVDFQQLDNVLHNLKLV